MSEKIYAPFSEEIVKALNRWQITGHVHPFTCANRDDPVHRERLNKDKGTLVATRHGWICLDCDYTQDWAHDFMAHDVPPNPLLNASG